MTCAYCGWWIESLHKFQVPMRWVHISAVQTIFKVYSIDIQCLYITIRAQSLTLWIFYHSLSCLKNTRIQKRHRGIIETRTQYSWDLVIFSSLSLSNLGFVVETHPKIKLQEHMVELNLFKPQPINCWYYGRYVVSQSYNCIIGFSTSPMYWK